ncbi:hypothetical protein [Candidatus Hodgkinia cicadicola]|uniref:hypothetical protein n=1 Tax=Candidatus Hodgkinia cicadicola TaxID=573658 RepID=UPI0011BAD404
MFDEHNKCYIGCGLFKWRIRWGWDLRVDKWWLMIDEENREQHRVGRWKKGLVYCVCWLDYLINYTEDVSN